jgi:N-acetylmuramoyl-L-alanine amidase
MKTIFLDAGHGGIRPTTGEYVTPGKGFKHSKGEFHNKTWFYEGVFNRQMARRIASYLKEAEVPFENVYHTWQDTSLKERVKLANNHHRLIRKGIYVSLHANAAPKERAGKARGFEIFTSPGQTASDAIAEDIFLAVRDEFKGMIMRADKSDGDHDKEANFYVLKWTTSPAVLIEFGFFDNYQDAVMMNNPEWQDSMAKVVANVLIKHAKK